jgi:hypothetical protein
MTEIIFAFPVRNRTSLSCIWIETGDPARPLACKWVVRQPGTASLPFTNPAQPQTRRLCA